MHEGPRQTGRAAGILLHPTALPGPSDHGDLGPHAYHFVHFLRDCGFRVWQTLPLGPTHADLSPYNCVSAHAGNPRLISQEKLKDEGWIEALERSRRESLKMAHKKFLQQASPEDRADFEAFLESSRYWLEDYSLYQVIRDNQGALPWYDWPIPLRKRLPAALKTIKEQLKAERAQVCFEQFLFFRHWNSLRKYANSQGIRMFGDMAIFVAHDSADVWAHQECFQLNEWGQPTVVAGVPPDYFSETGQRWGNPLYDWTNHEEEVIALWVARARTQAALFDLIRIDHFRGLESHWEIPASEPLPVSGRWAPTPGDRLLAALQAVPSASWVAEDLGVITEAVDALRQRYQLPGMHVLQFGFDEDPHNRHLPHAHDPNNVVYTGTHDNDTTLGWFHSLSWDAKQQILDYLGHPSEPMPWPLVRRCLASPAKLAILPMQDALGLGSEHRMNLPGTCTGNWKWRFHWSQVPSEIANRLARWTWCYGRT